MEGEERCDEGATPNGPGHPPQDQKQQQRIGGVEGGVDDVHRAGIEAEKLAVEDVGEGGNRMPVANDAGGERITDAWPGYAGFHLGLIRYVIRIIKAEKTVVLYGPINRQHEGGQHDTDGQYPTHLPLLSWKCGRKTN